MESSSIANNAVCCRKAEERGSGGCGAAFHFSGGRKLYAAGAFGPAAFLLSVLLSVLAFDSIAFSRRVMT